MFLSVITSDESLLTLVCCVKSFNSKGILCKYVISFASDIISRFLNPVEL